MKLAKCKWFQKELTFVDHKIDEEGIRPDPNNVAKIRDSLRLDNLREVRRFLGIVQFYRKHIKGFADIAGPLYDMFKKDVPREWTDNQE